MADFKRKKKGKILTIFSSDKHTSLVEARKETEFTEGYKVVEQNIWLQKLYFFSFGILQLQNLDLQKGHLIL